MSCSFDVFNSSAYFLIAFLISTLDAFEAGTVVTPESLVECGKVKQMKNGGVKVLGNGEITKALTVKAHAFSASAKEKIEAAGGTVEVID